LEMTMATNHFGPFLLTHLLIGEWNNSIVHSFIFWDRQLFSLLERKILLFKDYYSSINYSQWLHTF
jgi:hypothetical protein